MSTEPDKAPAGPELADVACYAASAVSEDDVEAVEDDVGMGCGAWDMVNPREIIAAAWNLLLKRHNGQSAGSAATTTEEQKA